MSEQTPPSAATVFGRVLTGLLRPLVRALIAQGVTAPAFYRMVKRIYVDVAEKDFALGDERQTDSRISVLTGVHRRDVRAFRDEDGSGDAAMEAKVATIVSVLGRWLASPETTDKTGSPRPLMRSGAQSTSFEDLVRAISKDIRPRTVLDELLRQNLVTLDDETGLVHLRTDAFLGPADPDQKVHFFAENVGDHIAAAVENLLSEDAPFMERAVFYNRLRTSSVDQIEAEARKLGTEALVSLNRLANDRQSADLEAADGTHRFRFGVFFYREDEADTGPTRKDVAGDGDDEKT